MTSKFAVLTTAAALLGASFLAAVPASAQGWHTPHQGYRSTPHARPHVVPAPQYRYGPADHHRSWRWRRHNPYGWHGPRHSYYGW